MTKIKSYIESHPWINFEIDFSKFNHRLWITIGEAQSKCDHIAGIPLHPDVQQELHNLYLAKGVHATTAIEGNTLSEKEVNQRIKGKLDLPPSREYLGKEVDNVVMGCNKIVKNLLSGGSVDLSVDEIKEFNKTILENLSLDEDTVPGDIRRHEVGVGRYKGAPAEDCEYLTRRMCDWLNREEFKKEDSFGILRAILAHLYIAWIHPFGDGNGRTARLIEFKILLLHKVPSSAAHLLSNHYNLTRDEYYRQFDYASKSGGDVVPFINYAIQGFIDGLKEQLEVIRSEQLRITWRNFIYDSFKDRTGLANERKRKLVLDMSEKFTMISFKEIRHISPRIAEFYAVKKDRTIRRDLDDLISMGLIKKEKSGFIVNQDKMKAFLPLRKQPL